MTNRRLITLIIAIMALALILPPGLSIWMTHRQAKETFMDQLETYSKLADMRTLRVVNESKTALRQLENWRGPVCTADHLLEMQRASYAHRYVQEVLYVDALQPHCSSLQNGTSTSPFPPPRKITADGFRVWLTRHNDLGLSRNMIAIGNEHYVVMVDPQSLIDILSYGSLPLHFSLVNTSTRQVIAGGTEIPRAVLEQIAQRAQTTEHFRESTYHIKYDASLGLATVTWMPDTPLENNWYRLLTIWVPFSLLMSLLLAFVLLKVLRRLQSPRYQLQEAIHRREIMAHYQPIMALESGRIVGAEALARWQQKDGSFLSPDIFIPLAVHSGLMPQLTRLMMENVFADMGSWLQQHPEQHISVNLEPADLLDPGLPALLAELLQRWQLSPSQIALELTERGFADPAVSGPAINTLRAAGHAIYIDDFGTGYCSLSYLQNLDVDTIKIDKSFVDALEQKTVTPHIIEMAKALKLAMVAEGIETEAQLQWLKQCGVEYGQGWLYSKALPAEEFIRWAENNLHEKGLCYC